MNLNDVFPSIVMLGLGLAIVVAVIADLLRHTHEDT